MILREPERDRLQLGRAEVGRDLAATALAALDSLESQRDTLTGVIVRSGKDGSFIAGADLDMLLNADTSDAVKLTEQFSRLQKMFRSQETGGKPMVAAINGTALGGGFEICLACHYRIAAANPKTKIGQPEVKIGLLPGGGGTQRIPRLIGVMNAAPILLEGKDLTVDAAKGLGLIHEVVPADQLLSRAKAWLTAENKETVVPAYAGKGGKPVDSRAVQPWDKPGFKTPGFPGGQVWSPAGVQTFIGGNAMIGFSSEGRLAFGAKAGGVAFLDAGQVWADAGAVRLGDLRYAAGVGFRYQTPVGPLRLDLGYQLTPIPGLLVNGTPQLRPWRLHFSIGQAFFFSSFPFVKGIPF